MSLINDALKKAARQRAQEHSDLGPLTPGGGGSRARQGGPMRTQTMVLIGAAAVALVVVSVVLTGAFVTSRPEAKPASPIPAPAPAKSPANVAAQAPSVIAVTVPRVIAPAPTAAPAPTSAPVVVAQPSPTPAPAVVAAAVAVPAAVPAVTAPAASAAPAPTAAPQSRAEQVQAYVDGLVVTGARSAGSDSKALVNGHVFKLNDVLDKALGLRLARVDPDHLTFVDGAGDTYLKSY
jgi:hypothetical protein